MRQAGFRDDDDWKRIGLTGLFVLRFIMCNLSNNQWQDVGKNLTGAAFGFAVFFSMWSFFLLWADATYCHYPTDVRQADDATIDQSYCYVFGEGLPSEGMASKVFMSDCDAHNQLMVGEYPDHCYSNCMSAAEVNVSFAQLFRPTSLTPTTGLSFEDGDLASVDLLPSQQTAFLQHAQSQRTHPEPGPEPEPPTCDTGDLDGACACRAGSMIEAIQMYAEECEDNERMRDSTLLVCTLFVLNMLELAILFKVSPSLPPHTVASLQGSLDCVCMRRSG